MFNFKQYIPLFLLLLVFGVAELIIHPTGEFALNDDFAYARAVYLWDKTGVFILGGWPAMSLFSHALLGLGFVKLFGFSYLSLRFANMVFCLFTIIFIYRYFIKFQKPWVSALACAFIIFNPYYMNLFNSFMTDLSFFNYSFIAFYFLHSYFESKKYFLLFLFFCFAAPAMLVRQVGIVLPIAFVIISLLQTIKNKNVKPLAISAIVFVFTLSVMYFFERNLIKHLEPGSAYQGLFFSKSNMKLDMSVVSRILEKTIALLKFSGILFLVCFILFFPSLQKRIQKAKKINVFAGSFAFIIALFFINHTEITGDVVINFGLGIESTVDRLYIGTNRYAGSCNGLYYLLFSFFILGYALFALWFSSSKPKHFFILNPAKQFLLLACLGYLILIGMAESSFDRYCIFVAFFVLIYLMQNSLIYSKISVVLSSVLLFFIASFSVLATKDYFSAAELKKKIRTELISENGINDFEINSGGEHQFWDKTDAEVNWINWDHFNDKKYLITRGPVDSFSVYKTYTYSRYMPPRTDTFYVLQKNVLK